MTVAARPTGVDREFAFDARHFEMLRNLARQIAGIELNDTKQELVYSRLARRLRARGLHTFDQYCELVGTPGSDELEDFVNAITTNLTSFFREEHHFEYLRDTALPALASRPGGQRRLRLWSAASSTGQEPYSIAMTVAATLRASSGWDCKVLGTDIDSNVVAHGNAGIYPISAISEIDPQWSAKTYFSPHPGMAEPSARANDELRAMTYFRVLNLMEPWPMQGPLDVIFCRNVVIYFSVETQRQLFKRFHELLAPDGYLFVGHSESMLHSAHLFESVGRTIYRPVHGTV